MVVQFTDGKAQLNRVEILVSILLHRLGAPPSAIKSFARGGMITNVACGF
jgi:hypothetical protein